MKTTIELSESLLEAVQEAARRQGTTLGGVLEAALRGYLERQADSPRPAFRLRRHTVGGKGLRPEAAEAGWERIRELSNQGRGG